MWLISPRRISNAVAPSRCIAYDTVTGKHTSRLATAEGLDYESPVFALALESAEQHLRERLRTIEEACQLAKEGMAHVGEPTVPAPDPEESAVKELLDELFGEDVDFIVSDDSEDDYREVEPSVFDDVPAWSDGVPISEAIRRMRDAGYWPNMLPTDAAKVNRLFEAHGLLARDEMGKAIPTELGRELGIDAIATRYGMQSVYTGVAKSSTATTCFSGTCTKASSHGQTTNVPGYCK